MAVELASRGSVAVEQRLPISLFVLCGSYLRKALLEHTALQELERGLVGFRSELGQFPSCSTDICDMLLCCYPKKIDLWRPKKESCKSQGFYICIFWMASQQFSDSPCCSSFSPPPPCAGIPERQFCFIIFFPKESMWVFLFVFSSAFIKLKL